MNSHNSKTATTDKDAGNRVVTDRKDVRVIRSSLTGIETLAISDDDDRGGDPYNSTGQHVIIKLKSASQD